MNIRKTKQLQEGVSNVLFLYLTLITMSWCSEFQYLSQKNRKAKNAKTSVNNFLAADNVTEVERTRDNPEELFYPQQS